MKTTSALGPYSYLQSKNIFNGVNLNLFFTHNG